MGVLTQEQFWDEVRSALGNRSRTDIPDSRITLGLNLAQSRIARSYDFSEMGQVSFAQMNFTRNAAIDKYLVPPPSTKSIHSFVVLDTSAASFGTQQPIPPTPSGTVSPIGSGGVAIGSGGVEIGTAVPAATTATTSTTTPIGSGGVAIGSGGTAIGSPVPSTGNGGGTTPPPSGWSGIPVNGAIGSLGQSRKVVEKPWRWFDAKFPAPEWLPPGWPSIYKRFGNLITMVPAPFLQFTAQLSYTTYPTRFDPEEPNQVSDFENKDDVIINKALAYFFQTLGRTDRAAYFEGLAKEQLDEAIERDDNRPDIEVSRDIPAIAGAPMGPYWADPFIKYSP